MEVNFTIMMSLYQKRDREREREGEHLCESAREETFIYKQKETHKTHMKLWLQLIIKFIINPSIDYVLKSINIWSIKCHKISDHSSPKPKLIYSRAKPKMI